MVATEAPPRRFPLPVEAPWRRWARIQGCRVSVENAAVGGADDAISSPGVRRGANAGLRYDSDFGISKWRKEEGQRDARRTDTSVVPGALRFLW